MMPNNFSLLLWILLLIVFLYIIITQINNRDKEDFENFSESINDQIFFCGEHTNLKYLATTHGALMSGIRVAKEVIEANED